MKPDSLVIMVNGYSQRDIDFLREIGITNFPTVGGGEYTVRDIFNWKDLKECVHKYGDWISLNEFPEMESKRIYLNIMDFREVQSPDDINVGEIIEDALFVKIKR